MTTTLELDHEVLKALEESLGAPAVKENLDQILISAIENKLEKCNREILLFETKYGVHFGEFARLWDDGKIHDPHGYQIESDYVDWEMLEMEKKDLIAALSRIRKSSSKGESLHPKNYGYFSNRKAGS